MSIARAHHYVPQVYLRQWAIDGRVAVRRRGSNAAFVAATSKVLQERDLYRLDHPDVRQDVVESVLSNLEGAIPEMLQALRMGWHPARGSAARDRYPNLLALQFVRTPDRLVLNRLPRLAMERAGGDTAIDDNLVRELFRDHVGREPIPEEVTGLRDFLHLSTRPGWEMDRINIVTAMFAPLD